MYLEKKQIYSNFAKYKALVVYVGHCGLSQ